MNLRASLLSVLLGIIGLMPASAATSDQVGATDAASANPASSPLTPVLAPNSASGAAGSPADPAPVAGVPSSTDTAIKPDATIPADAVTKNAVGSSAAPRPVDTAAASTAPGPATASPAPAVVPAIDTAAAPAAATTATAASQPPGAAAAAAASPSLAAAPSAAAARTVASSAALRNAATVANPAQTGLQADAKVALVIGNANYTGALPLKNAGNDATDMCEALRKLGFDVICKLDVASKRDFKAAIYEFTGKITSRSVALFYYAGHGLQVDGVNYLIPVKAELRTKSDIDDESIQINYLMSEMETRQAALNMFFLDACRNNPLVDPVRGYVPMTGLASQLYAPRNSIVAMSTGAGQLSLDGDGRNGTFTKNLLQHIATPRQTIEDTLKAVSSGTRADASRFQRQQDPQITISFADKFCMSGCSDPVPSAEDELLKAKTAELGRLQQTLEQTRAKQAELDSQHAMLLKKRAELEALRQGLEKDQAKEEESKRYQEEVATRERELDILDTKVKVSATKVNELESMRLSLLQKQQEIEQTRKAQALEQARIDARNKEIATRNATPPAEKKAPPVTVVPAF